MFKAILLTAICVTLAYSVVIVAVCAVIGKNYSLNKEVEDGD